MANAKAAIRIVEAPIFIGLPPAVAAHGELYLKTPALKEPVIERDHIIELFRSFMRVCDDINDKILECTEDMLDDSVVITSHYILNGMLHTKYRYLLFKVVTNISYCKK